MDVKAPVEVKLGAGSFGGVPFATILVTLPPSPFTLAEVQTFAPELLQLQDPDEAGNRNLVVDGQFVTTTINTNMEGCEEFMDALDQHGILVLNLMTYINNGDDEPQLLVRSMISENNTGRVISDTGPVTTTVDELDSVMAGLPGDVEDQLEGRVLDGANELAGLIDMSGKHRAVDPSSLN